MLILVIFGLLISVTTQVNCTNGYVKYPEARGSFKLHQVPATWEKAFLQCHKEGGVLASPANDVMRGVMQVIMENNGNSLSYFIGANARYTSGQYMSIEGVPLTNMPVGDMYSQLDKKNGKCLTMSETNIKEERCSKSLPYLCYRKLTKCGTLDKGYRYEPSAGSCYKVHRNVKPWREANSKCISEGGYLAILNNEFEAKMITNMIPDIRMSWAWNKGWEGLFIGVLDWDDNKTWLTHHGESLNPLFNSWDWNQPDRSPAKSDCGVLNRHGKLDNIPCFKVAPYICEKDPLNIYYSQDSQYQIRGYVGSGQGQ